MLTLVLLSFSAAEWLNLAWGLQGVSENRECTSGTECGAADTNVLSSVTLEAVSGEWHQFGTTCDPVPPHPPHPLHSPQVNGKSVVGMSHAEVVAAIRVGGDETSMLVVDEETDGFFQRCRVLPTEEHLTGRTLRAPRHQYQEQGRSLSPLLVRPN